MRYIWWKQPVHPPYQPQPLHKKAGFGLGLFAGVASFNYSGPAGISIVATDASGGTPPYTYQWQRSVDGGSFSNLPNGSGVTGATSLSLFDGSATTGHSYRYQLVYTDSLAAVATSNFVTAIVYTGGALGSGGTIFPVIGSFIIRGHK